MINCAIIGATGYTGIELIKILSRHPKVKMTALTTRQKEEIPVQKLVPSLPSDTGLVVRPLNFGEVKKTADVVFLCLPHTEALDAVQKFRAAGKIVIDLSADFRIQDAATYEAWYKVKHKQKQLLKEAVYGLPEIYREKLKKADLIANPGCYPTSVILGLAPLLKNRLVDVNTLIADSKSGVSGAGKKLSQATHFCSTNENFFPYKVGQHQHTPEIDQVLSDVASKEIKITFTAHLLPVNRGILSTIYAQKKKGTQPNAVRDAFESSYRSEPFVRIKPKGEFPALQNVQNNNYCEIGIWEDPKSDRVIVVTAIDNLVKGASGQAVQNMNIRCGFDEREGI